MKYLILVAKGMVYGVTNIVPGIGGGIMLILLGIYEQFVDALGNLLVKRDRWKEYLAFLVPVGFGTAVGMVLLAKLVMFLFDNYLAATMFFFMGLLIGTVPSIIKMHGDMRLTPARGLALLAGLAVVVGSRMFAPSENGAADVSGLGGALYNLLVAFLGGCASVTPGLDGSYALLLGGTYPAIMEALSALMHLEIQWAILVTTAVGALAGIIIFSKLIDTALKRAPSASYYGVLGLIGGAFYGLWPNADAMAKSHVLALILMFIIGAAIAWFASRIQEPAK